MKVKITDKNGKTQPGGKNELQWGKGVSHTAEGGNLKLCTDGVIHFYDDPYLAILMNPIQGGYTEEAMLMWEVETEGDIVTDGTKSGAKTLTTLRQIAKPDFTIEERVDAVIRCALKLPNQNKAWVEWANKWLSGEDRSEKSARYAAEYARYAAGYAGYAAESARCAAEYAAGCAGYAAGCAARVSEAAPFSLKDVIKEVIK